ncbi:hypothetical protein HML84_20370 [Alcanivorax sp. IO_7]|nr:hypothetical protein HML84_20370 [Alcanivorax sp. IO_7]
MVLGTLNNTGLLQSAGNLMLTLSTRLANSDDGQLLVQGDLTAKSRTGNAGYQIANRGLLEAGGLLCLTGGADCAAGDEPTASGGLDLALASDGIIKGGTVVIHGDQVTLDDQASWPATAISPWAPTGCS